jgi:cytochrome c oxidase assembly protein subunit 15
MVGGIFYEHGHRMVATFVGMLTIALAVWLQLRESRRWMRRLGWVALAAVLVQGLLGGLTVLFFLPRPVSISHASLAQLFFCTTVAIALFTSRWWLSEVEQRKGAAADDLRRFAVAMAAVVFFQLVLGASFRHRAIGILPHIVWAFVVLGFSIALSRKVRLGFPDVPSLRKAAALVSALVGAQILLGFAAWWSRLMAAEFPQPIPLMVGLTVMHVAVGAATLGAAVFMALCCYRVLPPASKVTNPSRPAFGGPLRVEGSEL